MRFFLKFFVLAAILTAGCASLVARKVPLDKRLAGEDGRYKGFRYYLSRPYLVVSERLCVTTYYEEAEVGSLKDQSEKEVRDASERPVYVLRALDDAGYRLYDLAGRPADATWARHTFVPATFKVDETLPAQPPQPQQPPKEDEAKVEKDKAAKPAPKPSESKDLKKDDALLPKKLKPPIEGALPRRMVSPPPSSPAETQPAPQLAVDNLVVVFLPDFEQQMVVKSRNFLSKSKFSLDFRDGWQLATVKGNHDSTEVPLAILNTIRTAIGAAAEVDAKQLGSRGTAAPPGTKDTSNLRTIRALISHTLYVDPGMYRLQKPSEQHAENCVVGGGLLADMGVPVQHEVKVQLLNAPLIPVPAKQPEQAPAKSGKEGTPLLIPVPEKK